MHITYDIYLTPNIPIFNVFYERILGMHSEQTKVFNKS